jgi:hypothetical protein
MIQRIKEAVFGETSQPEVGMSGLFEIGVSAEELETADVNSSNFIGVFFHHDDNGVLFVEAADSNGRNDVYLVDDLWLQQLAFDSDADTDGMGDRFEDEYGLDSENPDDADEDLDEDGLSNLVEYLLGSNPAAASVKFLPPVASVDGMVMITVPGQEMHEGRIYILEHSNDLGETDVWKAIDAFSPSSSEVGTGYVFEPAGPNETGFYRVRVEWAR